MGPEERGSVSRDWGNLDASLGLNTVNKHHSPLVIEGPLIPPARDEDTDSLFTNRNFLQASEVMGTFV